ncbi:3,4-dihydroxy-2-butanone-4-phosphate synthase [Rhodococcus koreensis]
MQITETGGPHSRPRRGVHEAVGALAAGQIILLVDDMTGTDSAAFVVGGSVSTAQMAVLIKEGSGFVEIAVDAATARRLQIPMMSGIDFDDRHPRSHEVAAVGVDAGSGVTTGISAADRACTARLISNARSGPEELRRPGHLLPVIVGSRALEHPASFSSGALALAYRAGAATAVHCGVVSRVADTEMARADEAIQIARSEGFVYTALSDLKAERAQEEASFLWSNG